MTVSAASVEAHPIPVDSPADMFCSCVFFAAVELFLVLPLCGGEEVIQDAPQVLECGPVLRLFPPAHQHDVVEPVWTVFRLWHPVVSLQLLYDLWVGHP